MRLIQFNGVAINADQIVEIERCGIEVVITYLNPPQRRWTFSSEAEAQANFHKLMAIVGGDSESKTIDHHEFWSKQDWNKTNRELVASTGYSYPTICAKRNRYGYRKYPGNTSKYSTIEWDKVNWVKQDCEIARELGIPINSVRFWRNKLKVPQPQNKGHKHYKNKRITEEKIEAADWVNMMDAEIAREWSVSRERVRQIRELRKKPSCRYGTISSATKKIIAWLYEHKSDVEGKSSLVVGAMIPNTIAANMHQANKAMRLSGLNFDWKKKSRPFLIPVDKIDWRLPSVLLEAIWNASHNRIATTRYNNQFPKPIWSLRGTTNPNKNPELIAAIHAQIDVAKTFGKVPREKWLSDYLESKEKVASTIRETGTSNTICAVLAMPGIFTCMELMQAVNAKLQTELSYSTFQSILYYLRKEGKAELIVPRRGRIAGKYRISAKNTGDVTGDAVGHVPSV